MPVYTPEVLSAVLPKFFPHLRMPKTVLEPLQQKIRASETLGELSHIRIPSYIHNASWNQFYLTKNLFWEEF